MTRSVVSKPAYCQNFSLNQYYGVSCSGTHCDRMFDGRHSLLSRDFDIAVIDADAQEEDDQPLTITVSSGNVGQQHANANYSWVDRALTLPPPPRRTSAVGGGELVQPDQWLCSGTRSDTYANLAYQAKHGTATAGWYNRI